MKTLLLALAFAATLGSISAASTQSYEATVLDHPSPQAHAWFGRAVAAVGDVNGDGVPDVLIGAHFQSVGPFANQGQAFVISGANQSLLRILNNPHPQTEAAFGWAVAGIGDINGDGVPDLAVAARDQYLGAWEEVGRVFLFSGSSGTLIRALDNPEPNPLSQFGFAVAGISDVNIDGVPDVLVGAIGYGNLFQGRAFVFSGADGSLLRTLRHPEPHILAFFGASVAGLGDLNGDGVPEVVVGASGQDIGDVTSPGRAYVFSGADGALLRTLDSPTPNRYGLFGNAIAAVKDANGDGVSDVLIGARVEDVGGNINQGRAFLFSGSDGRLLHSLDNPVPRTRASFGVAVADAGDVNGDGFSDLLIGAPGEYMFSEPSIQGVAYVFSGLNGTLLFTLDDPSPQANGLYGYAAAGVGDVNGDGVPDLLVGAPYQTIGQNDLQGRAFLFESRLPLLIAEVELCANRPWFCKEPSRYERAAVWLECSVRGCLIFDPIPKNCLAKFGCPGCEGARLCPPWYNIFVDGPRDIWSASLHDAKGKPVLHRNTPTATGIVLSFRPTKEHYIDGQIGDYFLVFKMGSKGKPGVEYRVPMRVERSDQPYTLPKP